MLVLASVYFTVALVAHLCVPLATGIARWESVTGSVVQLALDARRPPVVVAIYGMVVPLLFQIADSWLWFREWYTFCYWGLATWQHDFPWLLPMERVASLAVSYFLPPALAALACAVFGAAWLRRGADEASKKRTS